MLDYEIELILISVSTEIEFTPEFESWWDSLSESEQDSVRDGVELLARYGVALPFPHSSRVLGSRHSHMRELRIQHAGGPYRVLYAFDPQRAGILPIGGDKTGNNRWYDVYVPVADRLYDRHLIELEQEGLI